MFFGIVYAQLIEAAGSAHTTTWDDHRLVKFRHVHIGYRKAGEGASMKAAFLKWAMLMWNQGPLLCHVAWKWQPESCCMPFCAHRADLVLHSFHPGLFALLFGKLEVFFLRISLVACEMLRQLASETGFGAVCTLLFTWCSSRQGMF